MRTKLLTTLLALVLLCACVAGVLMLSAQAAGTDYVWSVDGVGTAEDSYLDINKAIAAAYSKKDWEAGDTLTIQITASNTAAADATGRLLFGKYSIFRADNTLLPITIDGGANRYGFGLNGTGYKDGHGISCTNDYTFTNMDLNWGSVETNFRAGCGQVTFDNVSFGAEAKMKFSADCSSRVIFDTWTEDRFNAMADANGIYTTTLSFYNTTYNAADNVVSARQIAGSYTTTDNNDGLTKKASDTRNKLVLGEGAVVGKVTVVNNKIVSTVPSDAYVLEVLDGATVTTINGCYDDIVYGNVINNISGGTITAFYGAGQKTTLYGNVTNNYTGGKITTYRGGSYQGTINGNVTNNFGTEDGSKTPEIAGFVGGNHESGAINGTITNNYYSIRMRGVMYGGNRKGDVRKIVNNFYDGFDLTRSDANIQYCGSNSTGKVFNCIENNFYGGTFTNTNASSQDFYCGNAANATFGTPTETITYRIKNTFKGGTFTGYRLIAGCNNASLASDSYGIENVFENDTDGSYLTPNTAFYATKSQNLSKVKNTFKGTLKKTICCGSNSGTVGSITNEFLAGCNQSSYIYAGNNSSGKVDSIVNKLEGGKIAHFYGAGRAGTVGSVVNTVGSAQTAGPEITNFIGGASTASGVVGTISNTIYSGTFTAKACGGSNDGTVEKVNNTVSGGNFTCSYYICGNYNATFTAKEDKSTVRIENNVTGGEFLRLVGGSYSADVDGSVKSTYDTAIVATTAVYAGNASGGDIAGSVNNTINGTVTDGKATIKVFYGGNNNGDGTIGDIVNTINGGQIRAFYGGCNYEGKPASITNVVNGGLFGCEFFQKLEEEETAYFCGGNRVADLSCDVDTILKNGTFINIYAGTLMGNDSGNVTMTLAPEGELTILGKAYGLTGATSGPQKPIFIGRDTYLSFASFTMSDYVYVRQTEGWDFDRYVVIPFAETDIGWSNAEGVTGAADAKLVGDEFVLSVGNATPIDSVSLILTDRIAIKLYFARGRVFDTFTYSFTGLRGEPLASGTVEDLVQEGDYYSLVLPAIGLSEFEKPFLLSGNSIQTTDLSIVDIADMGATYYSGKNAKYEKLFQSIADLGRSANAGTPEYGLTPEEVIYTPSQQTVKAGTEEVDVQTLTLVMSNAAGLTFKGMAAAPDAEIKVFIGGVDATELCRVTVATSKNASGKYDVTVELFLHVFAMSKELKIELKNGDESVTYLAMHTRADYIAQKIATPLAKDLLVYIQAVDAYKA